MIGWYVAAWFYVVNCLWILWELDRVEPHGPWWLLAADVLLWPVLQTWWLAQAVVRSIRK